MYKKIDRLLKNVSGIKYWDFREQTISSINVRAWNNEINNLIDGEKSGMCFRILLGNGWGFAYSYKNDIKQIVDKAVKIAKLMNKNSKDKKNVYIGKTIKDNKKSKWKINPKDISIEEKKNLVLKYSKLGEKKIVSKQTVYSDYNKKSFLTNSVGSEIKQEQVFCFVGIISTAKDKFIENYISKDGAQCGYEITSQLPRLNKEAHKNVIELLKAKLPKGGVSNIVADGCLAEVFIHEALGHASEADHLMEGASCLTGLGGKKIAKDFVNVYDDSRGKNSSWGGYFYDDEGIRSQKTAIVKNGILNSYLHSRETAAFLKTKPTGNGRAQDVSHKQQVRMSNTYIEKQDHSFEELLKELKNGFYLMGSKGGQVSPAKGSFHFSCVQGFVVKNGELKQRLRNVALSGKTLQTLKNICAVGNKYSKAWPGQCGKDGQWAFVAGKCPALLIKNAVVGGIK